MADSARKQPVALSSQRHLPAHKGAVPQLPDPLPIPEGHLLDLSECLHILSWRGESAQIVLPDYLATIRLLDLITQPALSIEIFGEPTIVATPYGLRFPTKIPEPVSSPADEGHRDQALATFAQMGMPLSYVLTVRSVRYTLRDVLRDSLASFNLEQELDWTIMAYALYLPPIRKWTNRFGQSYSFDDLALESMRRSPATLSCGGTHRLLGITALVRLTAMNLPVLSESTYFAAQEFLASALESSIQHHTSPGYWTPYWNLSDDDGPLGIDTDASRLVVTSHILQWLLQIDACVPDAILADSSTWLSQHIAPPATSLWNNVCAYTHSFELLSPHTHGTFTDDH